MKNKLMERLAKKEARRKELVTKSEASQDVAELRSINSEMQSLNDEIAELRGMIDAISDVAQDAVLPPPDTAAAPEQRTPGPIGAKQILATMRGDAGSHKDRAEAREKEIADADPYGTLEYRTAFMEFCKTGVIKPELRANAMTTTSDVSAIIPTTILNEIIRKVTIYGQVFARVRKMAIKAGVSVPILSLKPVATWIGESAVSDKQKVQANTNVTFSYYGLECRVGVSLLADTVTLVGFENTIIDLIVEAMVKAIDLGVIKGNGTGKMLGITEDTRVPAGQIITLAAADFTRWDSWKKKVFAKMPLAYKAGAVWLMASGTFEGYIDGMVDANGQPVGRVNYGITDGPQERFGGKPVIQVEDDVVANYDDASTNDIVAILTNLSNYCVNSNMQMTMFRYFDHDTNEWVDKAILIADGKLLDPNGVVIVKKGA